MDPLALLYERPGLPALDLPAPLVAAYGGPLGFARPRVVANFVSSIDGVVALPIAEESGHVVSGGSEADRFVMALLRACADVVLVGAGTFRKAAQDLFTAEAIYPPAAALFAETRARLGLPPAPRFALVTRSGAIDATGPALEGALLFTTTGAEAGLRARAPGSARVIAPGGGALTLSQVLAFLRAEGAGLVLTEGGPHVAGELVAAGALDELFVTLSPALFGRFDGDGRQSLAHGLDLGRVPLELASLRRHGSHLFARYLLQGVTTSP